MKKEISNFLEVEMEKSRKGKIKKRINNLTKWIATGNSLALNPGIQEEQIVPTRYRQEFLTIEWEQVHLRTIFLLILLFFFLFYIQITLINYNYKNGFTLICHNLKIKFDNFNYGKFYYINTSNNKKEEQNLIN